MDDGSIDGALFLTSDGNGADNSNVFVMTNVSSDLNQGNGVTTNSGSGFNLDEKQLCSIEEIIQVKLKDPLIIISVILLVIINIVVIAGNILVIVAVFVSSKLRTVTNHFIVSLAVADLLVGIAILPYSLSLHVFDVWMFGDVWCLGWLVFDVWLCTASIFNLCAISVDRYLAVTRPVRYRSIMTSRRAKLMITAVWIVSFIICFPPLLGWNNTSSLVIQEKTESIYTASSSSSSSSSLSSTFSVWSSPSNPIGSSPSLEFPSSETSSDIPSSSFSNWPLGSSIPNSVLPLSPAFVSSTVSSLSSSSSSSSSSSIANLTRVITSASTDNCCNNSSVRNNINNSNPKRSPLSNGSILLSASSDGHTMLDELLNGTYNALSNNYNASHNISNDKSDDNPNLHSQTTSFKECINVGTQCALFDEKAYVIYSALGSFYIPMSIMIFFYWRIYLVASRTSSALKRGYRTTKSSPGQSDEKLTLRIHRGYVNETGQQQLQSQSLQQQQQHLHLGDTSGNTLMAYTSGRSLNSSTKSTKSISSLSSSPRTRTGILKQSFNEHHQQANSTNSTELKSFNETSSCPSGSSCLTVSSSSVTPTGSRRKMPITVYRSTRLSAQLSAEPGANRERSPSNISDQSQNSISPCSSHKDNSSSVSGHHKRTGSAGKGSTSSGSKANTKLIISRFSRRANNTGKWQAKRFHAETKAAKTVGIIVGGFIACWFPFFTVYLLRAFYKDQISPFVLTVFYWLGYFNSAVNPIIYGLFSRDFRRAFKNIICKCKCREDTGVTSLIRQIHLPNLFQEELASNTETLVKLDSEEG